MVCLIKSKYKEELDLYTELLGSEKRAYAVLCCNNGYTLDKTKDGKPSKLYNDLLEYYKGDISKAVQKKAQLFTSDFTDEYGQWFLDGYKMPDKYKDVFDENGEPKLFKSGKQVELSKPGISEQAQLKLNNALSFIKNHLLIKQGPIRNRKIGHNLQTLNDYIESLYYDITGQRLDLDNGDIYDQIEFVINNTDFENDTKQRLEELKGEQRKPSSTYVPTTKSLVSGFLKNPDISKYSEELKLVLKKFLPNLFRDGNSMTKLRIGFYKHTIDKVYSRIQSESDNQWKRYFLNRSLQIKLLNFLDYLELSPDYKQQIKEKIFSEIVRYIERTGGKFFKNETALKKTKTNLTYMSEKGHGDYVQQLDFSKYYDKVSFKSTKHGRIEYGKAKSSNILLKIVNDNSIDSRLRKSAEFLLKYTKGQDFEVVFVDPGDRSLIENQTSSTASGVTDTMSRTIYIRVTNAFENKESTLIHEIAHSLTTTILYELLTNNTLAWKGLNKYIEHVNKFIDNGLFGAMAQNYWRTSPLEFVAEFFGNAEFQELLKELPPVKQGVFNNVFEEILNWLYELFTGKPANAFEQIKPVMEGLVVSQYNRDLINNVPIFELNYLDSEKSYFGTSDNKISLEELKDLTVESTERKPYVSPTTQLKLITTEDNIMSSQIQPKVSKNVKKRLREAEKKIKTSIQKELHIIGVRDSSLKLIDKLTQDIISGTQSKNKAYTSKRNKSVSYGDERQIARNQEAVNYVQEQQKTINEAIQEHDAEKQLTEQAKLVLDFIDRADTDINNVLQMLLNARDNDYELLYYNTDLFGNRLYQDPSGNSINALTASSNTVAKAFSFDDIQYITTDILGYYSNLLSNVELMLLAVPQGKNVIVDEIRDVVHSVGLHNRLRTASNMKLEAQEKMLGFYIDQRINQQESSELTDDMKQRLSINMKKWVKSQYDFGDLSGFQVWTQLISDSKSPIVRMMADEIYKMNQEINNAVVPVAENLEKALKDAETEYSVLGNHSPINVMTKLMQKDRRGFYNGDFIQPINRRQYFTDLEDFKSALLFGKGGLEDLLKSKIGDDSFELELDEHGEPIIPTDSEYDDVYKDYKRKMETFICDHANRRFTKEYYLSRIDTLSPTTLRVLDQFSKKIGELKNAATVDGKFRPDLLSSKQRTALSQLQKERQQLSNPYDELGELKDPDSTEGIVARELNEWLNKLSGQIKYVSDVETFNECLNNISTQAEKEQFKRMFAYVGLNPHMFDDLRSLEYIGDDLNVKDLIDEIKTLRKQRNKLLQLNKQQTSYLGYNWDQLFDIRTGEIKNEKLLTTIRDIEKQLYEKQQVLKMLRKHDPHDPQEVEEFEKNWRSTGDIWSNDRFTTMYYGSVNIDPTLNSTQTVFTPNHDTVFELVYDNYVRYLVDKGVSTEEANKKAAEILTVDQDVPLSMFMVQMPKSKQFEYEDEDGIKRKESSFAWVPNQLFSKIDTVDSSDKYINKEFDEDLNESVQPKKQFYEDKDYQEMLQHPKLHALYDQLVQGMKDVYDMLPYSGKYDMRLPQMGANTAAMLTRNLSVDYGLHFFKNAGSAFSRWANATEIDTEYYIPEQNRRPDGSLIKNIPIRYINRIDDSRNISSDLTGGVIAMLKMANNYKTKSQHVSRFEAILNSIKENDVATSNQSRAIEGMLDRLFYEKQNNSIPALDNLDKGSWYKRLFFGGSKTMLKRLGILRGASTLINLSCRGVSMIVSFLDPLLSTFVEAVTGKNYGARDLMHSTFEVCKELPQMLASIGRRKSYSKTMAIIDMLGMEKPVERRFANMSHSTLRRLLSDNLGMKGFEIGDYTIKALNVNSIYRNYRLYTDKNGETTFLNRYDYIQHCIQDGVSKKDAIRAYNSAKAACSYLTTKNGTLIFKGPMNEEQFIKIGNAAKKITQNITLMANDEDRTWLQTNPWTAFITMLRTFMILGFGERFKSYNDFIVGTDEFRDASTGKLTTEISDRNLTRQEIKQQKKQHYYRGGYNFMTGHIENGIYTSNFKALGKIIKATWKAKRSITSFFLKYGNMTLDELKKSDISLQEVYALKRIVLELGVVVGCVTLSVLCNRYCQDLDPDDDDNYWMFLLNAVLMRSGIERITMYNPQTVSDLVTSITTLTSASSKILGSLEVLGDFLGVTDHDPDEIIKSDSAYKGYKRSYRATMNAMSIFGTAGWFATMPKSLGGGGAKALDKSTSWYAKTAPWRLLYKNKDAKKKSAGGYSMDYGSMDYGDMSYGSMSY